MLLPDTFTFSYDPTTNRLTGCWPGAVADETLRAQYADLLTMAAAHGNCCFWLLDMRARNWHTPEFGRWFNSVFAEAAHAALHQSLFIAYVLGPEHQAAVNGLGAQATQRGCTKHGVYPFFFDCEADAREWLTHQQAYDKLN